MWPPGDGVTAGGDLESQAEPSTLRSWVQEEKPPEVRNVRCASRRAVRPCWAPFARLLPAFSHRYVYDHIGGEHSEVIPELAASVATFAVTTLWLGPCDIVYLWSLLNCFGLNFELWVQKLAEREPLAHMEVSREGQAGHPCFLKAPSHPRPPVQNFLTTTVLVVRTMAHLAGIWFSLASVWCGAPRLAMLVRPCPLSRPQFAHL